MRVWRIYAFVGVAVLSMFAVASLWELWLRDLLVGLIAGPGVPGPSPDERWRFILASGGMALLALVLPTWVAVRSMSAWDRAQATLRKLSLAVEHSPVSVLITDREGVIEYVNPRFQQHTEFSAEEAVGRKANLTRSGHTPPDVYVDLWRTISAGHEWRGEFPNRRKSGELYWENASISPVLNDKGAITHFVSVQEDITVRKEAEARVRANARQLRAILETSPIAVAITPVDRPTLLFGNSRFAELFGADPKRLIGADITRYMLTDVERRDLLDRLHQEHRLRDVEIEWRHVDGSNAWCLLTVQRVQFEGEDAVLWSAYDITEQKQAREQLAQLANHDLLTGLANRRLFLDHMGRALARARRSGKMGALLYFDLDGFKAINDTHGHACGDWLLEATAKRLRSCVRESDLVSRIGGDEFTLTLENVADAQAVQAVAGKVLDSLSTPFERNGRQLEISASIGIAFFGGVDGDPEELMRRADRAMYRAKKDGKGSAKIYDPVRDRLDA